MIVGAPGTGKSSQIRIQLAAVANPRRLIFDPMNEYGDAGEVLNLAATQKRLAVRNAGRAPGDFSFVYRPGTDDPQQLKIKFGVWCALAFSVGYLTAVIDELADVTSPNRYQIPPAWSQMMRQGRHRHIRIIAATQRPADMDKRVWSFATRIRTGRLNFSADQKELSGVLNVPLAEVAALINRQWIERDMQTGEVRRGSLEWRAGRPVDVIRTAPGGKKNSGAARRSIGKRPMA